jgi:uncharacterized protein (DUF58 family)
VHWLSTARTGTLMVRQYVDNRRPGLTVFLDHAAAAHPGPGAPSFELAVEVTTSVALGAITTGRPVTVRLGGSPVPTHTPDALLDHLTGVAVGVLPAQALDMTLVADPETSILVVVTGTRPADELIGPIERAGRSAHVVVVRCGDVANDPGLPGATTIRAASLEEFAIAWNTPIR